MTQQILCIFHAQKSGAWCDDGGGAAWAVHHRLGDTVEYYPDYYRQAGEEFELPPVEDRDVIIVDFSYKRPVMEEIIAKARSVLVLDHHKTAQAELAGLVSRNGKPAYSYANITEWTLGDTHYIPLSGNLGVTFDMERSGAGMAWDFFNPTEPRPDFINYLEDRDLWRKSLPGGDEFTIALRSYPQDFATWSVLAARGAQSLVSEGRPLLRYYRMRVEEIKMSGYLARLDPEYLKKIDVLPATEALRFRIANAPYFAASEVAGELANEPGANFGACYFEVAPDEWQYSLRSRGDVDVSEIARIFGGGGHKGAAGFTVPFPIHVTVLEDE